MTSCSLLPFLTLQTSHAFKRRHYFKLFDVEVIEKRHINVEGDDVTEYYVHYDGYDRRLDEWVRDDRIVECTSRLVDGKRGTRRDGKRKYDEISSEKVSHPCMHMHSMQMWCFSPAYEH